MGSVFLEIDERLHDWIERQRLFFVATAPSGDDGHVNLSPKGLGDTFRVTSPFQVAYVDLHGSGIETVAHLKQNGRIVVMFCAFEGPPKILRLHGVGTVVEQADPGFDELLANFSLEGDVLDSMRSIIRIDVTRISDSCGFVVPEMAFVRQRQQLFKSTASAIRRFGPEAIRDYCDVNNGQSIDGLHGLERFGDTVSEEKRARHAHEGRKL